MSKTKLSQWAKKQGVCYRTAWNWVTENKFPGKIEKTPSGSFFVIENEGNNEDIITTETCVVYGRVSSRDKKSDLESQITLCQQFAISKGWKIEKVYKEIASGMNDNRKFLNEILENPPQKLVVLHKDRLTRFGFNYIEILMKKLGCEVVVINLEDNKQDDIMKDLVAIITSFCCRLYGARRGQKKALELKETLNS